MKLMNLAVSAAAVVAMSTAYAGHNEQFFQAGEGEKVFTANFNLHSTDTTPKGGDKANTSGKKFSFSYEHALTKSLSLGGAITYVLDHQKAANNEDNRLDNLHLVFKGHMENGFHYGVDLELNTGSASQGAYDAMKEGLYAGYDFGSGWGARFDFLMAGETEAKATAGTEMGLTGYFEHDMAGAHWGYSGTYNMTGETKAAGSGQKDGSNSLTLKAYPTWELGDGDLVTGLSYTMLMGQETETLDSNTSLGIDVGYRMSF